MASRRAPAWAHRAYHPTRSGAVLKKNGLAALLPSTVGILAAEVSLDSGVEVLGYRELEPWPSAATASV